MNVTKIIQHVLVVGFLIITGCVEPYNPPSIKNAPSYLVVDAFVDATKASATVKLSRTTGLADKVPQPVTGATVQLETKDGSVTNLFENYDGNYSIFGLIIDFDMDYRIKISHENNEYASEFVQIKQTPPIEDLFSDPRPAGLEIKLSTSDPARINKYYRWKIEEVYEYTVPYFSGYTIQDGQVVVRQSIDQIYRCWRTDISTPILVGTTEELDSDDLRNLTLVTVPKKSIKLSKLYYIKVQQMALTKEGYDYWLALYKTTENVGGLFDPMPGRVSGNIRSLANPNETVIGFFYGASVSERELFINPFELPEEYWGFQWPFCPLDTLALNVLPSLASGTLLGEPVYGLGSPGPIGYTFANRACLDCTMHGGTNYKPFFWP